MKKQDLAAPELVEILRQLAAHRRAVYEQNFNGPRTREQSDAWWYHPLVGACDWLEDRLGISRHELEVAAIRLTTSQGLKGMDPLTGPDGRTTNAGQPDLLWMIPRFRELDRDGTTARLWKSLVEQYPAILANAGLIGELQATPIDPAPPEEPEGDTFTDDAALLPSCCEKAYRALMYACEKNEDELADRQAWVWLREHGLPDDQYKVPSNFRTFQRYVSKARTYYGEQKSEARAPAQPTRSIVNLSDLDSDREKRARQG